MSTDDFARSWLAGRDRGMLMTPRVGALLVAMPLLGDPNFDRTVVLLVSSYESGFQGLILNEPTREDVRSLLPHWWHAATAPRKLHRGGPVDPALVICLGVGRPQLSVEGIEPLVNYPQQTVYRIGGEVEPDAVISNLSGVRMFGGYAGWDAEQLEEEIEIGAWLCVPSISSDVLSPTSSSLWRQVLARQGGHGSFLRHCPENPSRN